MSPLDLNFLNILISFSTDTRRKRLHRFFSSAKRHKEQGFCRMRPDIASIFFLLHLYASVLSPAGLLAHLLAHVNQKEREGAARFTN